MKRRIAIFFAYAALFCLGYLALGIVVFYTQPQVRMLPDFIEQALPPNERLKAVSGGLAAMEFEVLHSENQDTTTILFDRFYNDSCGIFCFRGNAQRTAASRGVLAGRPDTIVLDWEFVTDYDNRLTEYGVWGGGSGWTGQPLIIQWPDKLKRKLYGLEDVFKGQRGFTEVLIGSLSGNIYFLDLKTGLPTRPYLSINNPIKGTISADPRLNGLLYVGQGIPNGDRFGSYVFNMFTGEEVFHRSGLDPEAYRLWGAFDSNPLIDPKTGYWFHPAENGMIYKTKVSPSGKIGEAVKLRYKVAGRPQLGLEASMGAWKNLGYFADNGGNLVCVDLTTMRPVWLADNHDDTDASMVVDVDKQNNPFLYVGNEVDLQGPNGHAYLRKIDGLTGKELWSVSRECSGTTIGGKVNSGGVLATMLVGKYKASDLVYGIFSRTGATMKGEFVALEKSTGKERFSIQMDAYSWASPVDLYDEEGNCYVFFTDVYGGIYLIDGVTGEMICHYKFPAVFESSPVAWNNRIIVGARGKKIYSFIVR